MYYPHNPNNVKVNPKIIIPNNIYIGLTFLLRSTKHIITALNGSMPIIIESKTFWSSKSVPPILAWKVVEKLMEKLIAGLIFSFLLMPIYRAIGVPTFFRHYNFH